MLAPLRHITRTTTRQCTLRNQDKCTKRMHETLPPCSLLVSTAYGHFRDCEGGQPTKLQPSQLQLRVARKRTADIFPRKFLSGLIKICAHFTTHTSRPRKSVGCGISLATILHAPCRHGFLYYRCRTEKE
ncbi:hypothetical protein IscW_ISCW004480 [Ixodes scapularis]|uniref:Uncharacterized protein n=1 Tax=Ixodes scapularis TaxID=6945 RepID=B7PHT4_IXOSC|nr:hypothetical protein IscW_ISCW004480 [Ixodes scapularis]|eukprot:XP_002403500.1 hypothetical protein IscW_ISCW004480 [Ixodes scapularis]